MSDEPKPFLSDEDKVTIRQQIDKAARSSKKGIIPPATEVERFLREAERRQLHPLNHELWFIERGGKWSVETGIDGLRTLAVRTGNYAGRDATIWTVGPNGLPLTATVTVYYMVQGLRCPFSMTVYRSEFAGRPGQTFAEDYPFHQLGKVAEAHAHRAAGVGAGLYILDEMGRDNANDQANAILAEEYAASAVAEAALHTQHRTVTPVVAAPVVAAPVVAPAPVAPPATPRSASDGDLEAPVAPPAANEFQLRAIRNLLKNGGEAPDAELVKHLMVQLKEKNAAHYGTPGKTFSQLLLEEDAKAIIGGWKDIKAGYDAKRRPQLALVTPMAEPVAEPVAEITKPEAEIAKPETEIVQQPSQALWTETPETVRPITASDPTPPTVGTMDELQNIAGLIQIAIEYFGVSIELGEGASLSERISAGKGLQVAEGGDYWLKNAAGERVKLSAKQASQLVRLTLHKQVRALEPDQRYRDVYTQDEAHLATEILGVYYLEAYTEDEQEIVLAKWSGQQALKEAA